MSFASNLSRSQAPTLPCPNAKEYVTPLQRSYIAQTLQHHTIFFLLRMCKLKHRTLDTALLRYDSEEGESRVL